MRPFSPACCRLILVGLLPLGVDAADPKKPVADAPPVFVSSGASKPKWANVEQLKKFAARGEPQACFELAERALEGDEVPQDVAQAVRLLEQAAQGGINNAWFRLGKIYHDGLTGAPDYTRTLDYYTRAARAGVPEAQHNLGAMLVSARGVNRDLVEGLAWLIVATKSGAVSGAEIQVRDRLAKRPADIQSAETRAGELIANLSAATVRAVPKAAPAPRSPSESRNVPPAPIIRNQVAKPVITVPPIDPLVPAKISLPPVSSPSLLPSDKP